MLLAPPLAKVLEQAAQAAPGTVPGPSLTSALEAAGQHLDQGRQFLDVVVWTLPPGDRSRDVEDRARQDLLDLREALGDVARAVGFSALPPEGGAEGKVQREPLERACRALAAASARLGDSLEELRRAEEASPRLFPLPEVERALRVARRIVQGPEGPRRAGAAPTGAFPSSSWRQGTSQDRAASAHAALQAFLPGAVGAVQRFSTTSPLAAELCGAPELARRLEEAARELEAPMGAMMTYVRTGRLEDLRAGLDRMEVLAPRVGELSTELRERIDRERGGRPAPFLLLHRALERHHGDGPVLFAGELEAYLHSARTDAEVMARQPLAMLDDADWDDLARVAREALARLESVVSQLRASTAMAPGALGTLEEAVTRLASTWEPAMQRWGARRDLLSRVPALRPGAEAVGGALLGRLGPAEVDPVLQGLEALAGDLTSQALQAGHAELAELLDQQRHSLQEGREALARGRRDLLRAAWLRLEADLPRIAEVSTELQEAARPGSGPTEYYDLAGETGEGAWTPRRLGELEALARRVAAGEAAFDDLAAEVGRWKQRLGEARSRARQDLLPRLEGDAEQASYVEFFLARLDSLEEGLRLLEGATRSRSLAELEEGLDLCRAAGEDMLAMRFQIGEFFR